LLLDHLWVDHAAELVGARHPDDLDFAGLVVNDDVGHQAGMGGGGVGVHLARLRVDGRERDEEDSPSGDGLALLELAGLGCSLDGDRPRRRAPNMDVAPAVRHEIGRVHLQLLGGRLEKHARGPRGRRQSRRCPCGAFRARRSCPCRADRLSLSAVVHVDVLDRTPSVSAASCRVTCFMPWPRSMADSAT
jgi:hypothetical protein